MQASPLKSQPETEKDTFLKELRQVTGPAHKRLEEVRLSKAIISDTISYEDYALYLSKMFAVADFFEKDIFQILSGILTDLDQRTKTPYLKKDLNFLKEKIAQLPSSPQFSISQNTTPAYTMGAMYVWEGSTLGGKYIFKNVTSVLSLSAEQGASYFNGYGAETGKLWSSFLEQFSNYAIHSTDKDEIIKGADDTFKKIFDLLNS